jgi:hypothetical protein
MYNLSHPYQESNVAKSYKQSEDLVLNDKTLLALTVIGAGITCYLVKTCADKIGDYTELKQKFIEHPSGSAVKTWDRVISDLKAAKRELEGYTYTTVTTISMGNTVMTIPQTHYHPPDEAAAEQYIESAKSNLSSAYGYDASTISGKLETLELEASTEYKAAISELSSMIEDATKVRNEYFEDVRPLAEKMYSAGGSAILHGVGATVSGVGTVISGLQYNKKVRNKGS